MMDTMAARDSEWLDLALIARTDVMCRAIGDILAEMDVPVTDWLWTQLHHVEELNTEGLADWDRAFRDNRQGPGAKPMTSESTSEDSKPASG